VILYPIRDNEASEILHYAAAVNGAALPPFQLDRATVMAEAERAEQMSVFDFLKREQLPLMIPLW
jgi:hypothetical protein